MGGVLPRALGVTVAGVVTSAVRGWLDNAAPGGQARWTRTNHRGEPVSLLEGPAVAAGLIVGASVGSGGGRAGAAVAVATAGAAAFGIVDDLGEDPHAKRKGLRGHLGALARGELTTGGLKVLGIGASALAASALALPRTGSRAAHVGDVVASGALVAGTANLVNLLDLRPGRALKAVSLASAPLVLAPGPGGGVAAAVAGASGAAFPYDLAETDMLGDGGANALGAAIGTALVLSAPRPVRLAALGVVLALTAASERVSFTRVIERTPVLRELDGWGRRPSHVPVAAGQAAESGAPGPGPTSA